MINREIRIIAMKNSLYFLTLCLLLAACKKDQSDQVAQSPTTPESTTAAAPPPPTTSPAPTSPRPINNEKKVLKPKPPNMPDEPVELKGVNLTTPLIQYMVRKGKKVYEEKCVGCHSLDGRRLEASTFQGITEKRAPEWIMNLTTGVQMKLADSKREQSQLEKCYTRQPGQRLNIEQSRDVLEYLRSNDGVE